MFEIDLCIQVNFEALYLTLMKCKLEYDMFLKTFRQFRVFVFDPIPENKNVESAGSFIKLFLLFQ